MRARRSRKPAMFTREATIMEDTLGGSDPLGPERRASERRPVVTEAILRRDGSSRFRARIFDLAETGCKAEMVERSSIADGIWVKLDGLEAIHATVSWVAPPVAGLEFDRPIHRAVFEALLKRLDPQR